MFPSSTQAGKSEKSISVRVLEPSFFTEKDINSVLRASICNSESAALPPLSGITRKPIPHS